MKKNIRHIFTISKVALFSLSLLFMACLDFSSPIEKMKEANKRDADELQRLRDLPDLAGVIITDDTITNPVSLRNSSLYALRVGAKQKVSGGKVGRSMKYMDYLFYDCVMDYPLGTQLLINGQLYPIDFKRAILSRVGKNIDDKQGITAEVFEVYNTNHGWGNAQAVLDYESFDSIRKTMKLRIQKIKGIHKIVDQYLEEKSRVDILVLREYNFKAGDTLILKGKLMDGKIVPLF